MIPAVARLDWWRTTLRLLVRADVQPAALQRFLVDEAAQLEESVSRFREDSELRAVNRQPGKWVEVSWYFIAALTAAIDAAEATDGLVDPALGGQVDAAGYRTWRGDGEPAPPWPGVPDGLWRGIEIEPGSGAARVRIPPGAQLDLGAIAKAWLADRLAESLWRQGLPVLADMGGDIRAIGSDPQWVLDVETPGIVGQSVPFGVPDAGLATSGTDRRQWCTASGQQRHHIIDPRTGDSALTPWRTVSVLAATATQANTASTAAVILGDSASAWLASLGLDALLVAAEGVTPVGRWPMSEVA